jgi:very-short-patch-repair endonuclease
VIARRQLLELGFSDAAIRQRLQTGRLHPVHRGVYAVGRPGLTRQGEWMAAVLACGKNAFLSHSPAAALWEIERARPGPIDVSIIGSERRPRRPGVRVHRRDSLSSSELTRRFAIPVTTPAATLVDLAAIVSTDRLEAAINAADRRDLIDPETLRVALQALPRRPGLAKLRRTLDRHTFSATDSELERQFLTLVRSAGLPMPLTQQRVNGYRVDFYWPGLGLVVETDGLRYHRTPVQQTRDHRRDQAHATSGLERLRFSRAQIRYEPEHVVETLENVIRRLSGSRGR